MHRVKYLYREGMHLFYILVKFCAINDPFRTACFIALNDEQDGMWVILRHYPKISRKI
jgi:hypothetical protein